MSDPYLGQVKQMAFSWPPRNYAFCDGATIAISANPSLYALLGVQFGGDSRNNFGLPDLRGRTPVGEDPSYYDYVQGSRGGMEGIVLSTSEMPAHTHSLMAMPTGGEYPLPAHMTQVEHGKVFANSILANDHSDEPIYYPPTNLSELNSGTSSTVGNAQMHYNIQPSLVINFVIALEGLFPSRS